MAGPTELEHLDAAAGRTARDGSAWGRPGRRGKMSAAATEQDGAVGRRRKGGRTAQIQTRG